MSELEITTTEFIDAIFEVEGLPAAENICVARLDQDKGFFHQMTPDSRAFKRWLKGDKPESWYFCISTVCDPETQTGKLRRRNQDAVMAYCVVLDDIGTKVDADNVPVDPSWEIETSPGNYQWGYLLEPTGDLDRVASLIDALAEAGYTDVGAKGFTRVVRLPGSANFKSEEPFYARLIAWNPKAVWTLDELITEFGVKLKPLGPKQEQPTQAVAVQGEVLDPVLNWLSDRQFIRDERLTNGFISITCPWAETHTDGDTRAGYAPLGMGNRPEIRGFNCFHAHCAHRTYKDFRDWVEEEGGPSRPGFDPLPFLQQEYVAVTQGQGPQIADVTSLRNGSYHWLLPAADWGMLHPGRIRVTEDRTVTVKTAFLEDEGTTRCVGLTYDPRGDTIMTDPANPRKQLLNTYRAPQHEEIEGEPEIFLEHIAFLLPDEAERECFLDWLAYKIQNPASRSYAVVMVADEAYGIGRSWLHHFLRRVFMGVEVKSTGLASVLGLGSAGGYNDWGNDCQLVVVEEAKDTIKREDFYHAYENIKIMIDTRPVEVRVNPKFGKIRQTTLWFNLLVFTNHVDALMIPDGDRRIAVFTNPSEKQDRAYYERLESAQNATEAARTYHWLAARDVSAFDPQRAPETDAKAVMIDASVSPLDEMANWVVKEYKHDLIYRTEVVRALQIAAEACGRPSYQHDLKALEGASKRLWRRLGALRVDDNRNEVRVRRDGRRVAVRALRDRAHWVDLCRRLDGDELRRELLKGLGSGKDGEVVPFRGKG